MRNTFLLEIIMAFEEEDQAEFKLFLESRVFQKEASTQEIRVLYETILLAAPDFSDEKLDKIVVFQSVFPGRAFLAGKLDKLMTDLKKLLRLYALIKGYISKENEAEQNIAWASWLRKKNLEERFRLAVNKLKSRKAEESVEEFAIRIKIAEEECKWESSHNYFFSDLGIPQLIYQLDLYYLAFKTDLSNRLLLQQKVANLATFEARRNEQKDYETKSSLLIMLEKINQILQKETPSVADIKEFAGLLEQKKENAATDVVGQYFTTLRNLCTLLIDSGKMEYVPILHQIHRNSMAEGNLLHFGKIEANSYLNVVQIAARAKEVAWAKQFIEGYKALIHGGDQDAFFYRYSMACCLFAEGRFSESLDLVPDEASSNYYHLMTRRLELKAYYELNSELFTYKLDAFRKFIERTAPKSIAANLRTMNLNFIHVLNQLIQSPPKDKDRAAKILRRIKEKTLICDRSWLMEKANALK